MTAPPAGIDLAAFAAKLEMRRAELTELSDGAADARKPVELDQQSIGRVSRQDALQQQAMAKAQDARRVMEIRKIDAAFARVKADEFGWCCECGEAIAVKRLEIDPTLEMCVSCAGAL